MNHLARLTLLAYPRSFRRRFGPEYLRTVDDLQAHARHRRVRLAIRLIGESLTTAVGMRWERLGIPATTPLTIAAAVAALVGLLMGSEAIAVVVVALAALAALVVAGRQRPTTRADPSPTRLWYWWLASAAGLFLAGCGVVAVTENEGGDLPEAAWATWMISWATAAVLTLVGLGLAGARLITRHR